MAFDKFFAKGVLFDLDGTLLDTADDLGFALNQVLKDYQLPLVSRERYITQASNGANAMLKLGFADEYEAHPHQKLRSEFLAYYEKHIAVKTTFFDGIENLLHWLNEHQIPWGVVTNKPEFLTTPLLKSFDLFLTSKVTVCGDTLAIAKPAPEPMWLAAETLDINSGDIIYLGDAHRDIVAGFEAGMKTAAVNWGYIASDDDVLSWRADYILEHPEELKLIIK